MEEIKNFKALNPNLVKKIETIENIQQEHRKKNLQKISSIEHLVTTILNNSRVHFEEEVISKEYRLRENNNLLVCGKFILDKYYQKVEILKNCLSLIRDLFYTIQILLILTSLLFLFFF